MSDRKEFEKWAAAEFDLTKGRLRVGLYQSVATRAAWSAWQAAQAQSIPECHGIANGKRTEDMSNKELRYHMQELSVICHRQADEIEALKAQAGDGKKKRYVSGTQVIRQFAIDSGPLLEAMQRIDPLTYTSFESLLNDMIDEGITVASEGDGEAYGRGYHDGRQSNIEQIPEFLYEALENLAQECEELFVYYKDEREKDAWDSPEYPAALVEAKSILKDYKPSSPQPAQTCPHIVNGGVGTSWCRLAAKPQVNQQLLELLKQAASYTRHNDYDWDVGFMRDVEAAIAAAQEWGDGTVIA